MKSYLLSELILLYEFFELFCQFHVLLPQLHIVRAVLFHLHFNIIQGHLKVEHGLLPLLIILPTPLCIFILSHNRSNQFYFSK